MRMRFGFLRFYVRIIYLFEFYHEIRMIKGRDRGLECVVECVEVRLQDTCSDDQLHRLSYLRPSLPTLGSDGSLPYASAGGRREQTNTNKQRIRVNFSISKNSMAQENFQYFPFFWQKISVVLNCTSRSEKGLQYCTVQSYSSATVLYRYSKYRIFMLFVADRQNIHVIHTVQYMYVSCSLTSHI